MESPYCLNCQEPIEKNYCSNCGQKTDTHRINFKHFIFHDILHGVWHFEKGIFFTVKEALTRPGKAALDYISGKRIKYYNVFYLTALLVGLNIFLANYYDHLELKYYPELHEIKLNKDLKSGDFLSDYAKILILSLIPLFALTSFILFRRKKLNLSEHFIVSGMTFLGVMLISTFSIFLSFLGFLEGFSTVAYIIDKITPIALLLYISFAYYNAFHLMYTKLNIILRVIAFDILLLLEIALFIIGTFFIFK